MSGMLISTMSMFLSRKGMLLFILILAGFFLFYTDAYNWKEKWKGWRAERSKRGVEKEEGRSSRLEKLKALKKAGLLTDEEYRARKREIDSL